MAQPLGEHRMVRDAYEVLEVRPDASQVVIQAAYRALASVFHPDAVSGSTRRMAELNAAYAQVRTPDRRREYDRLQQASKPRAQPMPAQTRAGGGPAATAVLDFGRYQGWSITDLARHDPDYLRWLSRHSSGIRFRREIAAALPPEGAPRADPTTGRRRR